MKRLFVFLTVFALAAALALTAAADTEKEALTANGAAGAEEEALTANEATGAEEKSEDAVTVAASAGDTALSPTEDTKTAMTGVAAVAAREGMVKAALAGKTVTFTDTDFKVALGVADLESVTLVKLPASTEGTLLLAGRRVRAGETVRRRYLPLLSFVPATKTVTEGHFAFTAKDLAGGAPIECTLRFVDRVNYAPKIDLEASADFSLWTQSGVPVYGKLNAQDPEGDALSYRIVAYPKNGTLRLSEDGSYRYTSQDDFSGKDGFSYVARDEYGNYTGVATVNVKVSKRLSDVRYTDMESAEEYNAAIVMCALGIMTGKTIGYDSYFLPDEAVSRAEFVAMAMKAKGLRADATLAASFFDDNGDIPKELLPYVATAQRLGVVNGTFDGTGLYFRPNDTVTVCEAATILSRLFGTDEAAETPVFAGASEIPVWARASVSSMLSRGVFGSDDALSPNAKLTRADVAKYLLKLVGV